MISYEQVLGRLKAAARPGQLVGMGRYGIATDNRLGVQMPELRALGKQIGTNHRLALRHIQNDCPFFRCSVFSYYYTKV